MSTIFGERLPLSGKGLHTQRHIGNDRNRYLWLKNLLQILSPTWYCQFYYTYLPNFVKHLILQLRPGLYTADHHSKTKIFVSYHLVFGWIIVGYIFVVIWLLLFTCPSANTYSLSNFSKILEKKFNLNFFQQNIAKLHISFCETNNLRQVQWLHINVIPPTLFPGENSTWFTIKYGICIVPILSILMLFQKLLRMQSLECMECWRFWNIYFFKIKKSHWYWNDSVSWYISIFLQIVIFIKITNFLFETFDEVAEVNLKFQIERWQEYFWCWNIISTTNKITEIFYGVEILFPPKIFLVLKYYPYHQWNNIVIPTPGIFMGKLRSSVMGVNFLYYPIEFALTLSFQALTK